MSRSIAAFVIGTLILPAHVVGQSLDGVWRTRGYGYLFQKGFWDEERKEIGHWTDRNST